MAWYPAATRMELQPESDAQPAIRPTQFILHSIAAPWTARRMYEYWRGSDRRLERLPGGVPFQVRRCGAQEFRPVTELPESVVARGAHQAADAFPAAPSSIRAATVIVVNRQSEPRVVGLLADGARASLARQHLRVAARRQPVQRLTLRVPSAASAAPLQPVLGPGIPVEHVRMEPEEAGAALFLALRVPVMRLGVPPVRQRGQLASRIALPIVAGTQPLADVLPRAAGELASSCLHCRTAAHTMGGTRACVSVALPPLVMHGAPPPRAHAYGAAAALDSAGELIHADISPQETFPRPKEAP